MSSCAFWGQDNAMWDADQTAWSGGCTVDCIKWKDADKIWYNANWMWSACSSSAPPICITWGSASVLWMQANWMWIECSSSNPIPPPPPPPVPVINVHPDGIDATTLIQPWIIEPWNPYRAGEIKKKKSIKINFRMNNKEYGETREMKDLKLEMGEVRFSLEPESSIDLKVTI